MDKIKILVIEDEKPIARFLELELSHEGKISIDRSTRKGTRLTISLSDRRS